MYIGTNLKARRQEMGLALGPLARSSGISVQDLSAFERDHAQPTIEQLFTLSLELNTTIDYLLNGASDTPGLDMCAYCGVSYHPMMRWSNGRKMICVCSPDVCQAIGYDYPGCQEQAQAEGFYPRPESTPKR